jgi:hypothetical protein
MGWVVNGTFRPLYPRGGWFGPRAGLDGCENFWPLPTGFRSLALTDRKELLYRLIYPGPYHYAFNFSTNLFPTGTGLFWMFIARGSDSVNTWKGVDMLVALYRTTRCHNPKKIAVFVVTVSCRSTHSIALIILRSQFVTFPYGRILKNVFVRWATMAFCSKRTSLN